MASVFRNRWWVVFATICGLLVGAGPINVFTFGVFLKPITEDLGLSRGAFSAALTFHATIAAIVLPLIGWLVDRWGARRVVLPGLFLYALATASYGLLQASPLLLTFLIFALTGLVGGVQSPIPYAAVIAQWFDRQRGLALGIGTAGVGLGVALVPQVAALLIDAVGWRLAMSDWRSLCSWSHFHQSRCFCASRPILPPECRGAGSRLSRRRLYPESRQERRFVPGFSGGSPSRFSSTSSRSTAP